jgi:ABC-type nickel/cobalt efflux system permease component RcnA
VSHARLRTTARTLAVGAHRHTIDPAHKKTKEPTRHGIFSAGQRNDTPTQLQSPFNVLCIGLPRGRTQHVCAGARGPGLGVRSGRLTRTGIGVARSKRLRARCPALGGQQSDATARPAGLLAGGPACRELKVRSAHASTHHARKRHAHEHASDTAQA